MRKYRAVLPLLLALFLGGVSTVRAADAEITFNWAPPTQWEDGSAMTAADIQGYTIERASVCGGSFSAVGTAPGGTATTYKLKAPPALGACYRFRTVASNGMVSDPGNEVYVAAIKTPRSVSVSVTVKVTP